MAATSASRLDLPPAAPPFDVSVAYARGQLYSTKARHLTLPPSCLLPPPPLPAACGGPLAPVGCAYSGGTPPAFPPFPWSPPPPLPATRCGIAEIDESPKAEAEDNFSPRSVLTPWRRATPTPASPPPLPLVVGGKRAFDPTSDKTSLMICNIPNSFVKRRFMAILDQHCAQENNNPRVARRGLRQIGVRLPLPPDRLQDKVQQGVRVRQHDDGDGGAAAARVPPRPQLGRHRLREGVRGGARRHPGRGRAVGALLRIQVPLRRQQGVPAGAVRPAAGRAPEVGGARHRPRGGPPALTKPDQSARRPYVSSSSSPKFALI